MALKKKRWRTELSQRLGVWKPNPINGSELTNFKKSWREGSEHGRGIRFYQGTAILLGLIVAMVEAYEVFTGK